MTVAAWLAERAACAPPALTEAVRAALGREGERPVADATDVLLDAAERLLAGFVARDPASRDGALALLTIDALVTFALETAAGRPGELDERARRAMLQLCALAGAPA